MTLERNTPVIRVIDGGGCRTGSIQRVESDDGERVTLEDMHTEYNSRTHNEVDPQIPGFRSYLVLFDGGETDKLLAEWRSA